MKHLTTLLMVSALALCALSATAAETQHHDTTLQATGHPDCDAGPMCIATIDVDHAMSVPALPDFTVAELAADAVAPTCEKKGTGEAIGQTCACASTCAETGQRCATTCPCASPSPADLRVATSQHRPAFTKSGLKKVDLCQIGEQRTRFNFQHRTRPSNRLSASVQPARRC